MTKAKSRISPSKNEEQHKNPDKETRKRIKKIDGDIENLTKEVSKHFSQLEKLRKSKIIPFLTNAEISREMVNNIYDEHKSLIKNKAEKLEIIVDSAGGDLDATYHLISLFRKMTSGELTFIVPRWAKSAATCLVCGGDSLIMGDTSEIGPVDPQLTIMREGKKGETFSPLSIKTMLSMLGELYNDGHEEFIKQISKELRPLSLGEHMHSLRVSPTYISTILKSRMLKNKSDEEVEEIANQLGQSYPHHGYCILAEDAKEMGINVKSMSVTQWNIVWNIWKKYKQIVWLNMKRKELLDGVTPHKKTPKIASQKKQDQIIGILKAR